MTKCHVPVFYRATEMLSGATPGLRGPSQRRVDIERKKHPLRSTCTGDANSKPAIRGTLSAGQDSTRLSQII